MKLPKLNLICAKDGLRPTMDYIFINKTDIVATDGIVLVILDKKEMFGERLKDVNNIFIRSEHWELFTKTYKSIIVDVQNQYIKIYRKGNYFDICPFEDESKIGKYPNYSAIIPSQSNVHAVERIGINPFLLQKLAQAIPTEDTNLILRFDGETKAIYVTSTNNNCKSKGIIMPVLINDKK